MSNSYPEYLNPFAEDVKRKPKLSVRDSFKEFGKTLRQSFRIKKKEDEVIIRPKEAKFQRLPIPSTSPPPEALPRSRFRERLSRDQYRDTISVNPFDEENNAAKQVMIRKRGKKRAPLPPKSISSQHINNDTFESSDRGGSHWSLTSVETDYSSSMDCCREEENPTNKNRNSLVEPFVDFNKNMNALKDDTNNNIITKDELEDNKSSCNIPDLVVSCPSENNCDKLQQNEDEDKKSLKEDIEKLEDKKNSYSEDELIVKDITNNMINETHNEEKQNGELPKQENEEQPEQQNEIQPEQQNEKQPEQQNEKQPEQQNKANSELQSENDENFLYYEKKSLYIGDSRDELNESNTYTGQVSLFITGSCDDLDSSNNNNVCNKNIPDENRNDGALPTPKQRKNKLTKNILLGM